MAKPIVSYRRIDQLKARAFDCGFTNEDAKQFGKLSKTATWEALLKTYGIPLQLVDTVYSVDTEAQSLDTSDWTNDGSFPVCNFTRQNSTNFLDWVDFGQFIALLLASAGSLCWLCPCGDKSTLLIYSPQFESTFKSGQKYELTTAPIWWRPIRCWQTFS